MSLRRAWRNEPARIFEIWNYTQSTWGEEQADKYVRDLIEAIQRTGQNRDCLRPVQDPAPRGIFFIKQAHHFIFFKEFTRRDIGVISILHESMDLPSRLRDDAITARRGTRQPRAGAPSLLCVGDFLRDGGSQGELVERAVELQLDDEHGVGQLVDRQMQQAQAGFLLRVVAGR